MWAQFGRKYRFFDAPVGLFFTFHRDLVLGTWIDMGMFLENVMLAARGQGLHTCPQAAWIEYPETVRETWAFPARRCWSAACVWATRTRPRPRTGS